MEQKKYLSVGSMLVYGVGMMGFQLAVGYMNSYQSQFYSSILGANLMYVAIIILVSKLISAIVDPFIGNLIDRSKFKSGKMRPFILISAVPFTLLSILIFIAIDFKTQIGMYAYILVTTVLWNIAMSFADIPSQGMLAVLSPRAGERNAAAGIANMLKSVGLAAASVIVPLVCVITKSPGGAILKEQYLISALFMGLFGMALYILIYFFNRELVPTKSNKMSIKEMAKELKDNKMLFIVFLTFMLGFGRNMGMGIGVQAAATLLKDGITLFGQQFAGENLVWLIGTTSAISSTIMIITVPMINKKWGEKKTFIVFAVYGFVVTLSAFILYSSGIKALRSVWAILAYQFIIGFSFGPNGYLPMVMVSDIVDYREWQTGKRTEGTQFAVLSLSNKISNALSVAVGIFIVGAAGYEKGVLITEKMQTIIFAAYVLIPGVCMLLSMIPMFFYKIDFKTKELMRKELVERRGELCLDYDIIDNMEIEKEQVEAPKSICGEDEKNSDKDESGGTEQENGNDLAAGEITE